MKVHLLLVLLLLKLTGTLTLMNTAFIGTSALCMEKDLEEKAKDRKAHRPLLKLLTHPKDFTWEDMKEVMSKISFDKIDPKDATKSFQHRLEESGYYFTIKSKTSLTSLFNNFSELPYRLALKAGPNLVMLDTQLMYEIIVVGATGDKMIADCMISYVAENTVKLSARVPFIRTIQKKSSRKAHAKFLERASSRLEVLSAERKDLKERTIRSEYHAQEAMQHIDAFYAADKSDVKELSETSSILSSSAHSSPTRTRSRVLERVRAKTEEEKMERREQKAKDAKEAIGSYYTSLGSKSRKLDRSLAKSKYITHEDEASTSESSLNSSSDSGEDSPDEGDSSESNSFK